MEEFFINTFLTSLLCSIIFLITAVITYYFPPTKINRLYGYRTGTSMKTQQHWDFAQRYSALQMMKGSLALVILSLLGYFLPISAAAKIYISLMLLGIMIAYLIITTEMAIKKKFNNPS